MLNYGKKNKYTKKYARIYEKYKKYINIYTIEFIYIFF